MVNFACRVDRRSFRRIHSVDERRLLPNRPRGSWNMFPDWRSHTLRLNTTYSPDSDNSHNDGSKAARTESEQPGRNLS